MTKLRIQAQLLVIAVFNLLLNAVPFFFLKRAFLTLTGSTIGAKTYLHVPIYLTRPGRLAIGANSTINHGCYIDTRGGVLIGTNVMVGHRTRIYTAGHAIDDPLFSGNKGSVEIGDNAVIFPNCLILPGTRIGEGAVVYPGSVVTSSVDAFTVVGGNPAKVIRIRSKNLAYKLDYGFWFTNA